MREVYVEMSLLFAKQSASLNVLPYHCMLVAPVAVAAGSGVLKKTCLIVRSNSHAAPFWSVLVGISTRYPVSRMVLLISSHSHYNHFKRKT